MNCGQHQPSWQIFQAQDNIEETDSLPIPKPEQYKDWFLYFDKMDLRRHLSEIEIVMIEAALEKTDGMVSQASDALKLRRTTLIEKMKNMEYPTKINFFYCLYVLVHFLVT